MKATTAEKWITQTEIGRDEFGNDRQMYDQIPEVESIEAAKSLRLPISSESF